MEKEQRKLTTRQHRLRDWLEANFESGRFFSIEEIVRGVVDSEGEPYYTLNTNPKVHDKCACLSADVRAINWCIVDRYKIIIKDDKGGCKLAENASEFNDWYEEQKTKLETKYKYLNNLKFKAQRDGIIPVVNQADRALDIEEMKPVEVFKRENDNQ